MEQWVLVISSTPNKLLHCCGMKEFSSLWLILNHVNEIIAAEIEQIYIVWGKNQIRYTPCLSLFITLITLFLIKSDITHSFMVLATSAIRVQVEFYIFCKNLINQTIFVFDQTPF